MGVSKLGKTLKDFYIPDYILLPGSEFKDVAHMPMCPVLVFINSQSGGQLGNELLKTYSDVLNANQVFDVRKKAPDKVLHQFYINVEMLKQKGDHLAFEIRKRLRIVIAGGDGTASWILGVVCDLKLPHPPPIATVPLGTGNNLPFSFGWGKKNPGTDRKSVMMFLDKVRAAKEMKIDSWHIIMRMRASKEGHCNPLPSLELPHSLHSVHGGSPKDGEGLHTYRGGFWNYFSMGMDAQVSYAFHSERKLHPKKSKHQLVNQVSYAKYGCTQGWFWTSIRHPSSRNIARLTKVKIMKRDGLWEDLRIPRSIRSIVCLNLPSFAGGLDPWGTPNRRKLCDRDLTPPYVDDGLLEIVGFRDAWHGLILFAPNGHGTRLAQANRIRFEFRKGAASHAFMRIDVEPWKQPLPVDDEDEAVILEISHFGQVGILATPRCQAHSVKEASVHDEEEENVNVDESVKEDWGERRKLGAADTFRMPDGVNISPL